MAKLQVCSHVPGGMERYPRLGAMFSSGVTYDEEFRHRWIKMRDCLEVGLPEVDEKAQVSMKSTVIIHVSSDQLVSFRPEDITSPPGLLFQWVWRSEPRTTLELEELANLVSLLSRLMMLYSKGMRSYITSMSSPASYVETRCYGVVPLKVNINTWRVMNGRMVTHSNLDRRGVDLDFVRCPLCDDGIEMKDHIFVHYKIAK
ncbi:RNA-directed DNA polymerase, eukaryota, reverse transcriptase zinc-binding domain protein [Tanacetum coccineum]